MELAADLRDDLLGARWVEAHGAPLRIAVEVFAGHEKILPPQTIEKGRQLPSYA